jgi:hypothetical protein
VKRGKRALALALALYAREATAAVVLRGATEAVDAKKLEELVDLELGAPADVEEIAIDLSANKAAIVLKRIGGDVRSGAVDLPPSGSGAIERTIALFIGEISREAPAGPPPTAPVPAAPPADEPPAPARPPSAERFVFAEAHGRGFTSGGTLFVGALVGGDLVASKHVVVGVRARYARASEDVALGNVRSEWLMAGPALSYRAALGRIVWIDPGVSVDGAYLWGRGSGTGAHSASGFAVVPTAFVEARWLLSRTWRLTTAMEGGWFGPGLDLRAGPRTVLAASGAFVGARAGLGVAF